MNYWKDEKGEAGKERHKAWQNILNNNRNRRLYVDPDIDVSRLADEMNAQSDVEIAIEQDDQTAIDWLESEIVLFN